MAETASATGEIVTEIRSHSRELVRELGFMRRTLAGTDLSPSGVHAVLEIGNATALAHGDLRERLILEKSSVSRLVAGLIARGLVAEARGRDDGRIKRLRLTARGRRTHQAIQAFAEKQVASATAGMDAATLASVTDGLAAYARALKALRTGKRPASRPSGDFDLIEGYAPGVVGWIVERHAIYHGREMGFGAAFETRVARDLSEFVGRIGSPANFLLRAEVNGRMVGSIAIDGEDLGSGRAHLRWFILDDAMQGRGIGSRMLARTLEFCDAAGFAETHLWTLKGLEAARVLYERTGFTMTEEYVGEQWGTRIVERKYVRPCPAWNGA